MLNKLVVLTLTLLIVLTGSFFANAYQNEPSGWHGNKWGTSKNDLQNIPEIQLVPGDETGGSAIIPGVKMDIYQVVENKTLYAAFIDDKLTAVFKHHILDEQLKPLENLIKRYGEPTSMRPIPNGIFVGWKGTITVITFTANKAAKKTLVAYISSKIMNEITNIPPERKKDEGQPTWNDPRYYGPGRRVAQIGVMMPVY